MAVSKNQLGKNIRHIRECRELTQTELAAKCGISSMHLSYIERGLRSPSLSTLQVIAKALGCQIDQLLKAG